jgi:hypothetical protein
MGPPPPSFPQMGTYDGRQPIHRSFIIIPTLLPLSTISQGGNREFSWSGSPPMFVLSYAEVGTGDMGQPLQIIFRLLSQRTS